MGQKRKTEATDLIPRENIESKIFPLRGKRIMLDRDLARLYKVKNMATDSASP